jgi:hypothetical protein
VEQSTKAGQPDTGNRKAKFRRSRHTPVTGLAPAPKLLRTPLATGTRYLWLQSSQPNHFCAYASVQNVSRITTPSTVASSVDHGSVEFGGNDDATSRRWEVFKTRLTLFGAAAGSPGFGPSANSEVATMEEQQRWSYQPPYDTRRSHPISMGSING